MEKYDYDNGPILITRHVTLSNELCGVTHNDYIAIRPYQYSILPRFRLTKSPMSDDYNLWLHIRFYVEKFGLVKKHVQKDVWVHEQYVYFNDEYNLTMVEIDCEGNKNTVLRWDINNLNKMSREDIVREYERMLKE